MNEQQSDDLYIPPFFFTLPSKEGGNVRGTDDIEDFLKNVQGWSEYAAPDEHDEWN